MIIKNGEIPLTDYIPQKKVTSVKNIMENILGKSGKLLSEN